MPFQVEILGEDNHLFVMEIETVLDAPEKGQEVICGNCKKKTKVKSVGIPGRSPRQPVPQAKNQKNLFKE